MPQINNTFLKSKMNKDLDARLVPNGEYRDAQNINVNKSEGSDVGALENVLGNSVITIIRSSIEQLEREKINQRYLTGVKPGEITFPKLEVIGYYMDLNGDNIYMFLTDYADSSNNRLSNFAPADYVDTSGGFPGNWIYKGAGCYIVRYNTINNQSRVLVAGNFLNFSKTHPIVNVNLLESLLFFTDDRNQPRKINVETAFNDSWELWNASVPGSNPYYYNEDHISVAKFAPYEPFEFLNSGNSSTLISNSEEFLPANIVTDLAVGTSAPGTNFTITGDYDISPVGPNVDIAVGDRLVIPSQPQTVAANIDSTIRLNIAVVSAGAASQTDITVNPNAGRAFDLGTKCYIERKNPSYDSGYKGDKNLMQDEFARFSYRFRYDDGEYSLMAPFTQAAFVPKNFGYFIDEDDQKAKESGVVGFMENRVDQVKLNLTLPVLANDLKSALKVEEIQILVKNSDELNVRVIEEVNVGDVSGATTAYEYDYLATKPIKVLPEANLTRVHDKIPVRALTQEVVSNRVVYANFIDKHSSPNNLVYYLNYSKKSTTSNLTKELPLHTVKQNRNYQVGVVLIDRYGRASNVLLNDPSLLISGSKNSTIYAPYDNYDDNSLNYLGHGLDFNLTQKIPTSDGDIEGYPGLYSETNPLGYYTYRIVVKQQEQDYYNIYVPGAISGSINWTTPGIPSASTSLQPYTAANRINSLPSFSNLTSFVNISLLGDNINKVPRDLREVNSNDTEFSSSTVLFNRVNPIYDGSTSYNIQQLNVTGSGQDVVSIKPFKDIGRWATTKGSVYPGQVLDTTSGSGTLIPNPWYPYFTTGAISPSNNLQFNFHDIFFKASENPFIATIETNFSIGSTPEYTNNTTIERSFSDLGVFETQPTFSNIDIYWESSTSGLITDLNNTISSAYYPIGLRDSAGNDTSTGGSLQYIQNENMVVNTDATLHFQLVNSDTNIIPTDSILSIVSVIDGDRVDRSSEFTIDKVNINTFAIQTNSLFVFISNSNSKEKYTFNLLATDNSGLSYFTNVPLVVENCTLQNTAPNWVVQPPALTVTSVGAPGDIKIFDINKTAVNNGSVDSLRGNDELVLTIENVGNTNPVPGATQFIFKETATIYSLYVINPKNFGTYNLKIKATDANGTGLSTDSNDFQVVLN